MRYVRLWVIRVFAYISKIGDFRSATKMYISGSLEKSKQAATKEGSSNVSKKMLILNLLANILAIVSINALSVRWKTEGTISLAQTNNTGVINSAKRLGVMYVLHLQEVYSNPDLHYISYPPGSPDLPYIYQVPFSLEPLELVCFGFDYKPLMNIRRVSALMRRLISLFDIGLNPHRPLTEGTWYDSGIAAATRWTIALELKTAFDERGGSRRVMTYGVFSNVLKGMNQIRIDYPHLTFSCLAGTPQSISVTTLRFKLN